MWNRPSILNRPRMWNKICLPGHVSKYTCGKLIALILIFVMSKGINADTEVRFSGFSNIHATYSDSEQLGFKSQILNNARERFSLAPDSLLGLQTNIQFNSDWDAVGQVILQDRYDPHFSNLLELAFIRYSVDRNIDIKIGRFSTQSYLFTDFRYVGHAANWVRPPVEMYSQIGSLGNMDGVNFSYRQSIGNNLAKLSIAFGKSDIRNDEEDAKFRTDYDDLLTVNFEVQGQDWRIQSAYMTSILNNIVFSDSDIIRNSVELAPAPLESFYQNIVDAFLPQGKKVTYFSVGGQYSINDWEFFAEYGDYGSKWALSRGTRSGYVSLAYTFDNITPYAIIASSKTKDKSDVVDIDILTAILPPSLQATILPEAILVNQTSRNNFVSQNSLSFGLRWDIDTSLSLKLEANHYRVDGSGSGLFKTDTTPNSPVESINYNVFSVGVTTTF